MEYRTEFDSMVGKLTLASDGKALTGLWIENQKFFARTLEASAIEKEDLEVFDRAKAWLSEYFVGRNPKIDLPLQPRGTEFQQKIWKKLREIPYGEVTTYKRIAEAIAKEDGRAFGAFQAVGGAVGRNPISILIPCHRVVGSDGSMTGYAGGIENKITLLKLEKAFIHLPQ